MGTLSGCPRVQPDTTPSGMNLLHNWITSMEIKCTEKNMVEKYPRDDDDDDNRSGRVGRLPGNEGPGLLQVLP